MDFPALPRTEAISFRDAKTKIFPGNKCFNFMRHEAVFTRVVLYLNYPVVASRKANFARSHIAASLPTKVGWNKVAYSCNDWRCQGEKVDSKQGKVFTA